MTAFARSHSALRQRALYAVFTAGAKKKSPPALPTPGTTKRIHYQSRPSPMIPKILGGFKMNDKNFYIQAISDLMERCNDLSLLDLIYKILIKAVNV